MAIKSIFFLIVFAATCGGAIFMPMIGVVGYVAHYHVAPEGAWWGQLIADLGIRYSLIIACCAIVGVVVRYSSLRYGNKLLTRQEWLIVAMGAVVWLSTIIGGSPAAAAFGGDDAPAIKFTKIVIFMLVLTHVVTTVERLSVLLWVFVVGVGYLGFQAYQAGASAFASATRLNTIGGPDFSEANGLAAYLASFSAASANLLNSSSVGARPCGLSGGKNRSESVSRHSASRRHLFCSICVSMFRSVGLTTS